MIHIIIIVIINSYNNYDIIFFCMCDTMLKLVYSISFFVNLSLLGESRKAAERISGITTFRNTREISRIVIKPGETGNIHHSSLSCNNMIKSNISIMCICMSFIIIQI